eukprot:2180237-Pleurochrysis_carterae.AAC.1
MLRLSGTRRVHDRSQWADCTLRSHTLPILLPYRRFDSPICKEASTRERAAAANTKRAVAVR